jgi:hypothetical protein
VCFRPQFGQEAAPRLKEGDFVGARKALDESLKIRTDAGEKVLLAETRMLQAEVSLEGGGAAAEAEATVRQTITDFAEGNERDDEAQAWALLAADNRSLPAASVKQLASIAAEARKRGYLEVEFEARLGAAELEKKSSSKAPAELHLSALESEARARGFALIAQKAEAVRAS